MCVFVADNLAPSKVGFCCPDYGKGHGHNKWSVYFFNVETRDKDARDIQKRSLSRF